MLALNEKNDWYMSMQASVGEGSSARGKGASVKAPSYLSAAGS